MRSMYLTLALLVSGGYALSTWLEPWFQQWSGNRTKSANLLAVALGDSRRLFARHVYAKADAYFHRGYYPSIFDTRPGSGTMHMASNIGGRADHSAEDAAFLGKPRDWIEAFGRHFYPSQHKHLGEGQQHDGHGHHEGEPSDAGNGVREERELLPWLKLAATLDPDQPQTFVVASYWLRTQLDKPDEAERFLREGLRTNPGHPELLFELGRIFSENRKDTARARNVWEIALRNCEADAATEFLVHAEILIHLAKIEYDAKNFDHARDYVIRLKKVSPSQAGLEKWLRDLEAAGAGKAVQ